MQTSEGREGSFDEVPVGCSVQYDSPYDQAPHWNTMTSSNNRRAYNDEFRFICKQAVCAASATVSQMTQRCRDRRKLAGPYATFQLGSSNRGLLYENFTRPLTLRCPGDTHVLEVQDIVGGAAVFEVDSIRARSVAPWIGREDLRTSFEHLPKCVLLRLPWSNSGHHGDISFTTTLRANVLVGTYCEGPAERSACSPRSLRARLEGLDLNSTDIRSLLSSGGGIVHWGSRVVNAGETFSLPAGYGRVAIAVTSEVNHSMISHRWSSRGNLDGWCEPGYGKNIYTWLAGPVMQAFHKCAFTVTMDWISPPPGGWFLDWGSACGHQLVWAKQLYGLHVVGVDSEVKSVKWARQHAPSLDLVCDGDGRALSWLPNDFFHGALAFGAIYALTLEDQCATVIQIIQKLRPGGRAVVGYNAPDIDHWSDRARYAQPSWMVPATSSWQECFQGKGLWSKGRGLPSGVSVQFDVMNENSWYMGPNMEASYALRLTRL